MGLIKKRIILKMVEKIWKDPVWSKVISVGILLLVGIISDHYISWWKELKINFNKFIFNCTQTIELEYWKFYLLILGSFFFFLLIILILHGIIKENSNQNKPTPSWKKYTTDIFFGVECHWEYSDFSTAPINIYYLCPSCQYQLYPLRHSNVHYIDSTTIFKCENCNTTYEEIFTNPIYVENKIILKVQQKIRTGSWE